MNIGKFAQSLKRMFSKNEFRLPTVEQEIFTPQQPLANSKRRVAHMLNWAANFNARQGNIVLEKSLESIYLKAHKNPRRRKARGLFSRTKPVRVLTGQPGGNAHDRRIARRKGEIHGETHYRTASA